MKTNIKWYIKNRIYGQCLKYTTMVLGLAEDTLRPTVRQPKPRKGLLSPRMESLRSEEGPFIPTADSHGQTADLLGPTEGLVRSAETLWLTEDLLRPAGHLRLTSVWLSSLVERLSDSLRVLTCQLRVPSGHSRSIQASRWSYQTDINLSKADRGPFRSTETYQTNIGLIAGRVMAFLG